MTALTVNELIDELTRLKNAGKGDLPVHFTYNYGDHWKTEVAPTIELVDVGQVVYSDYHSMDKVIERDDDWTPEDEARLADKNPTTAILLR